MKYLSIVFLILFTVTGCSSVALKRYDNDLAEIFFAKHPVRPDICPKEHIRNFDQILPGDAVYTAPIRNLPISKHQRCNDLYGGCSYYFYNEREEFCVEMPSPYGYADKETCLVKGGEWHDSFWFGTWCELPYIEE